MSAADLDIHSPYELRDADRETFDERGHVKLEGVLSPEVLEHYAEEITRLVVELNAMNLPMEERSTYERAFLQVVNLWQHSDVVEEFVRGRRLGRIAARLLGVRGVRLYHDQALYKEPGSGHTPWHADQYYWPLATDRCCTAWVPLQDTPLEMGPLGFAAGSHRFEEGRDLPISDDSERRISGAIEAAGFDQEVGPFALGDVSFHRGWTFHRAGPNRTDRPRRVMTIIYMDVDMRLAEPANDNQAIDRAAFCPGAMVGEVIDTALNPVIWVADD